MAERDGVGEDGEDSVKHLRLPLPGKSGWQLPAGCGGPSKLRRDYGDVDDQLPGCLELVARLKNLEEMSQQMVESQG